MLTFGVEEMGVGSFSLDRDTGSRMDQGFREVRVRTLSRENNGEGL